MIDYNTYINATYILFWMVEARVYVCEECRKRALRGEPIHIFLDGPRECYLDNADVYKCQHLIIALEAVDKVRKVKAKYK